MGRAKKLVEGKIKNFRKTRLEKKPEQTADEKKLVKIQNLRQVGERVERASNPSRRENPLKRLGFNIRHLAGKKSGERREVVAKFFQNKRESLRREAATLSHRIHVARRWCNVEVGRIKPPKKARPLVPEPVIAGFEAVYNSVPAAIDDDDENSMEAFADMILAVRQAVGGDEGGPFPEMPPFRFEPDEIMTVVRHLEN